MKRGKRLKKIGIVIVIIKEHWELVTIYTSQSKGDLTYRLMTFKNNHEYKDEMIYE